MVGQPARVGRGLRTIAINLSKMAKESATFEAANGKVNISLQKENGEMRSTYEILQQLGEVWGTLNETEQTSIATTIACKTQFETFANIMKNWGTAAKVVDEATKANGSSLKENEKYLDSIEGKLQSFQSAWEQLSYHVINSDFLKGVIDLGTDLIKVLDTLVQKIGTLPTLIGLIGTAFGGLKLFKFAEGLLTIGTAAETAAEGVEAVAEASAVASGAKSLGGLKSIIGFLSNPLVIGGIAALGVALGSIAFEKYFSLGSSIERLNEYQDKLKEVSSEIEQLQEKRGTDEGLTRAEALHLNVLLAEERSLERQVELEKQRVQNAFKKDIKTSRKGETGLPQISAYQSARTAELDIYKQMEEKQRMIDDARKKLGYAYATNNQKDIERYKNVLEVFDKELTKLDSQRTKFSSEVASTSAELLSYWEQVVGSVDYSKLTSEEQDAFNDLHKNVVTSQLDIENLQSDYNDFATIINSTIDSLGYDSIDIFSGIDFSKITTLDDLITTIKENLKSLDGDKEITFSVRDKDGNIEEITKKVSELDDKDIQSIISFNAEGVEEVESKKEEASKDTTAIVHVAQEGAQAVSGVIDTAAKDRDTTVKVKESGAGSVRSTIDALTKPVTTIVNIVKNVTTKQSAKGKRKGEQGGLSWLGDEGSAQNPKPELVVGENGAYLAGTGGWELYNLKSSDTVYTASQTKKLLDGSQIFSGSVGELPRFKKGKKAKKKATAATNANVAKAQAKVKNAKSKKAKKKAKKNLEKLKKKRDKTRSAFDKELEQLKHKAKVNHWTDAKYQSEYQKLYNKYEAYLSGDQSDDYTEAREDYENQVATDNFNRRIGNISMGHGNLATLVSDIRANTNLSADEKTDAIADAYKASVEYNLKEYENGKKTRDKVVKDIKNYYKTRGKYDEDYYKMLDELREADQKKEVERLKKLEEQQENKLILAQKYLNKELSAIEKQIDAEKEQEENEKKLVELQNELNKAKSQTIRIYREGQGFVYEQDAEAIKNAQEALDEYTSSQTKSALEKRAEEIRAILDLFDEMEENSAIHELELALGVNGLSSLTGGNLGSDIGKWSSWIKGVIASQVAYADLGKIIGDLNGADIDKWLGDVLSGGNHEVSSSVISEYLAKHSFASGTLSASGGLSILGEHGAELAWLGKGDSVYSNAISRNLMEWGRYNPAQVLSHHNSTASQVFNFDKIVLPNVRNAHDFYMELQKLPNIAIQQSIRRY